MPPVVPYTDLTRRYVDLKDRPSAERLHEAEEATAADLAREFLESVSAFTEF